MRRAATRSRPGFFQMSEPLGTPATISNNILVAQPTLAFGKGWGDFDFQMTLSQQYPVHAIGPTPAATMTAFGDPILGNTALQYHLFKYFWPANSRSITHPGPTVYVPASTRSC